MKTIYLKVLEQEGQFVKEKQIRAKVINENEYGDVTVEFTINGKEEIRVIPNNQYSTSPYLMSF